jgi:hypothetical protein
VILLSFPGKDGLSHLDLSFLLTVTDIVGLHETIERCDNIIMTIVPPCHFRCSEATIIALCHYLFLIIVLKNIVIDQSLVRVKHVYP